MSCIVGTLTTLARSALLQERVLLVVSRQIQALFAAKPDIKMDDLDLSRSKESLNALFQTLVDRGQNDLQAAATFLTPEQLSAATTIQSNYFNALRTQMTLGQQIIKNTAKRSN